jgi:hypothetical protein
MSPPLLRPRHPSTTAPADDCISPCQQLLTDERSLATREARARRPAGERLAMDAIVAVEDRRRASRSIAVDGSVTANLRRPCADPDVERIRHARAGGLPLGGVALYTMGFFRSGSSLTKMGA